MRRKNPVESLGGNIRRLLLSVEFLVSLLIQTPLFWLVDRLGIEGYRHAIVLFSVILVYCIGALIRKRFGLKSLIRSLE